MSAREAIPEDFDFDPSHRRQLTLARHLLGIAINRMPKEPTQAGLWSAVVRPDELKEIALKNGLVRYDDYHHAPACPANNWSRQRLPEGPCTCGAEREQIR